MATVYRARDKRLGREVAVKIIHRHLRENKEVGQRFASEARAVAKVKRSEARVSCSRNLRPRRRRRRKSPRDCRLRAGAVRSLADRLRTA